MEQYRCLGVFRYIACLAASLVGIENKSVRAMAFQQDHSRGRLPVGTGGGNRHRIAIIDLGFARFGKPVIEQGKGIGHDMSLTFRDALANKQNFARRQERIIC